MKTILPFIIIGVMIIVGFYYTIKTVQYVSNATVMIGTYHTNGTSCIVYEKARTKERNTNVWDDVLCEWVR